MSVSGSDAPRSRPRRLRKILTMLALLAAAYGFWQARDRWAGRFGMSTSAIESSPAGHEDGHDHDHGHADSERETLEISLQARKNLGLVSKPLRVANYWRKVAIPGEVVDLPGVSDRGVTSPAVGVVTRIDAVPGDTVRPGERLFTIRLLSDYVQNSQAELFKATRETELVLEQRQRLTSAGSAGAIPQSRLIELDQSLRRLEASVRSYRQDLIARGIRPEQIDQIIEGNFVTEIEVLAPPLVGDRPADAGMGVFEVGDLQVELGTQVQAGQTLVMLADHQQLWISGKAFKREAPYLARAAEENWEVEVEFAEDAPGAWEDTLGAQGDTLGAQGDKLGAGEDAPQRFAIRHLANAVDPDSRTFQFVIPLRNESRSYERDGKRFVVWRYRPGQRVRLNVPVEELKDVIVVPAGAIVREGPEAYLFRQNGDLFDRLAVRVLHEDRATVVIANDGSVAPGWFVAQNSAASLNRVLKAQAASGTPVGFHVHADGTVHGAH